jgi:probable addiction module antidote protein
MKKTTKLTAGVYFHDDLVERLKNDEEYQILLIKTSFEENMDCPGAILTAIRLVAEARGFSQFAKDADLNRENLYRVLTQDGNPRLDTFFKILEALNIRLTASKKRAS